MIIHPFPPFYNKDSQILILGSFPSVKSREQGFFYGHTNNRFWLVTSKVFGSPLPRSIEEKKDFLLTYKIALWDVIASCEITGSADSSIKNVTPNNLSVIIESSNIKKIFVNGKSAEKYYKKYSHALTSLEPIYLPSTSPANASWTVDKLITEWQKIKIVES